MFSACFRIPQKIQDDIKCKATWDKVVKDTFVSISKVNHPDANFSYFVSRVKENLQNELENCDPKWARRAMDVVESTLEEELAQQAWFHDLMATNRGDETVNMEGVTRILPAAWTELGECTR